MSWLATALIVGCGGNSSVAPTPDARAADDPWQPAAALPAAVQETAVATLLGKVYVLGGFEGRSGETGAVRIYDPSSDLWSDGPSLPTPAHHLGAAVLGDSIYVLGGLKGLSFTEIGNVWRLDAGGSEGVELASMPTGTERGAGLAVTDGSQIYVVGGLRAGQVVTDVSAYDPVSDGWSELLAPVPVGRDHLVGGFAGGRLVAVGGRNVSISAITGRVDIYDPVADAWTEGAGMLTPRAGAAAAVVGDRIVVVGGEGSGSASGVFAEAEVYDATADSWSALPDMPVPRHGMGAAAVGARVIVPGGADVQGFGAVDTVEVLTVE
jgi:N-acetylneuraminic acid mutarotase